MLDHDTLIAEQSGVATVWLISTLGSKSSYKRITKKDIQQVSIPETCNVIKNPPKPIALRLTSSLLYGVALVYKQKTEYLNNDTVNIKSRIQRDFYANQNADRLLIKTNVNFLKTKFANNSNHQVFLNDDPLFDVNALLPPVSGLDFLQLDSATQTAETSRRDKIREADLANNTGSIVLSSVSKSSDESSLFTRNIGADDLDNNNPEFAFDDNGLLLELPDETTDLVHGLNVDEIQGGEFDLGFDYDFGDAEPHVEQLQKVVEPDAEGTPLPGTVGGHTPVTDPPTKSKNPKLKGKKRSRTTVTDIIVDDRISLSTDDLRKSRDDYVGNMGKRAVKKSKKQSPLERLKESIAQDSFLPQIEIANIKSSEHRGRSRLREFEELDGDDFVDGLMRNRHSSSSIEIRRNRSTPRRDSRASISAVDLPLGENTEVDQDFDFDFGEAPIQDFFPDTTEHEGSSKKHRSSSSVRRFQTVHENNEIKDFNFDLSIDPVRYSDRLATPSQFVRSSQIESEDDSEVARKSLKFLKFMETRCDEVGNDTIKFSTLLEDQTNRKSIVVKSFYEVLQLTTLNKVNIISEKEATGEIQTAEDFAIRLV